MNINKRKAFSMVALITVANIIGKLLGFAKDILISYYYGVSVITDAIFLSMSIPFLILGILTSSMDSAIIPQYNRIMHNEGRLNADKHFSNISNIFCILGFLISLTMLFFPNLYIAFFAPGFNQEQTYYAVYFLKLFSFFGFFHILFCLFSAYNAIFGRVIPRAILSFSTNALVVLALLLFPDPRMKSLALAFFIGSLLSGIVPIISALRHEYKHSFYKIDFDEESKIFIKNFIPIMGSALLVNLNMFVDRFLASSMELGSISYINYASRITSMFDSMLIIGLGILIIPLLSQSKATNNKEKLRKDSTHIIKLFILLLLPIMEICLLFSKEIMQVIYMRGEFGVKQLEIVSSIFLCYSPQVLLIPLQALLAKIFHSIEDTKTPFKTSFMSVIFNIIASILLSIPFGLIGIAIATSIGAILNIVLLMYYLFKNLGWDSTIFSHRDFIKINFLILILACVGFFVKFLILTALYKIILSLIFGSIVYIGLVWKLLPKDFGFLVNFKSK